MCYFHMVEKIDFFIKLQTALITLLLLTLLLYTLLFCTITMRNLCGYISRVKIDQSEHTAINNRLPFECSLKQLECDNLHSYKFYHQQLINNVQVGVSNSALDPIKDDHKRYFRVPTYKLSIGNNILYYERHQLVIWVQTGVIDIKYIKKYNIHIEVSQSHFMFEYSLRDDQYLQYFARTLALNSCTYMIFNNLRLDTPPIYKICMQFHAPNLETTCVNYKNLASHAAVNKYNYHIKRKNGKRQLSNYFYFPEAFIRTATSQTIIDGKLLLSVDLGFIQTIMLEINKTWYIL